MTELLQHFQAASTIQQRNVDILTKAVKKFFLLNLEINYRVVAVTMGTAP